jgi:hypothetical protein
MNHVVEVFSTPEQLSTSVRQSLRALYGEASEPVPALLPYIADRHLQIEDFAAAAQNNSFDRSPSLIVVHGAPGQAQHKFIEYMHEHLVGPHLGIIGPVRMTPVALRRTELDEPDVISRRIANACSLDLRVDAEGLASQLHNFGRVTILKFPVEVELRWGRPQIQWLSKLIAYFDRWPPLRPVRVLPVISVQYRELPGWSGRLGRKSANHERTAEAMQALAASAEVSVLVLPELTNVTRPEVEVWAEREEVRRFLRDRDLMPEIQQIFDRHERVSNERGMPMEKLAAALNNILHSPSRWDRAV